MTTTEHTVDTVVRMPSLGESVEEGMVTRWLKSPGDRVEAEEPLLEVATDKVDTEIPSPCSGTLTQLLVDENEMVAVGADLATIATVSAPDRIVVAPLAPPLVAEPPAVEPVPVMSAPVDSDTEKLPRIRRTIAKRMVESLQVAAQLTTVVEVDLSAVARVRAEYKDEFHARTGAKLSYLPFFTKAAIEALPAHRMLNASLNADVTEVTYHRDVHLGMAVDSPKGLMVPVIRDASQMPISRLATAIAELADKVRSGKITADELGGGTFTITNTGSRGALFDTPIINQPQTAILGTGAVVDRLVPAGADGALCIQVRPMAYLSLSYDHRIVDGADAARYLSAVKQLLESGFTAAELAD